MWKLTLWVQPTMEGPCQPSITLDRPAPTPCCPCIRVASTAPGAVTVLEHRWGEDVAALGPPFDFVFGCDLMYLEDAIPDLVSTLKAVAASWQLPPARGAAGGAAGAGSPGVDRDGRAGNGDAGGALAGEAASCSRSGRGTQIMIAHGRNRGAEAEFLRRCRGVFDVARVPGSELDPLYQCSDVDVLRLTLAGGGAE
jgi:hypothetical protein